MMTAHDIRRMAQVETALAAMGGTHSFEDIIGLVEAGRMQSFADDDTWVVTQILDFPRKRVLEIFLVVGTLEGVKAIEPAVMDFAAQIGADLVRAFGRDGWLPASQGYGWHNGARIFWKDL